MKYWVITLLVLTALFIVGGCSSSAPEMSAALAPATDASGSGTRIASALNWGPTTVLDSSYSPCKTGKSIATIGGNPAVSYATWSNQGPEPGFTVYYARANDSAGTSWGNPVPVAFWRFLHNYDNYTSLRDVNGKPAIAFQAFHNGLAYCDVRFVRAEDAVGNTWGSPVIVDPFDDNWQDYKGTGTTLMMVNGKPAITYKDAGSQKYVRAKKTDGSRWGTPQIIRGTFTIVNGYPTLRYVDSGVLYFRRAADANGDRWLDPVVIGYGSSFGTFIIVEGQPAVTYTDNGELYYCRATDAYGDSWGASAHLGHDNDLPHSFALVNGNPAVAFTNGSGVLYFCRAQNTTGDSWGEAQIVLDAVAPAPLKQLFVVNGNPAIAFSGKSIHTLSSIRFIRALDAAGTSWPSAPIDITVRGDLDIEWLHSVAIINGMPSIFFYSGTDIAVHPEPPEEDVPPAYGTVYLNFVQGLDSNGGVWETPETVYESGNASTGSPLLTISETGAGIAFRDAWHAMNYIASFPAPPDPAVNVQLSTDKSGYISGEDDLALLTAVVTDEYGYPIGGLAASAFATTLDGGSVTVTFSDGSTAGTYTGTLDISGLTAGDHTVETTVTDTRAVSGSDSASFSMSEPGAGGTMHVGDLDGSLVDGPANRWGAIFTVKIEDSSESPVSGAVVSFSLGGDASGSGQITTGDDGTAVYQTGLYRRDNPTFTFTVDDVTHATKTYDSADNHDPDGDFPDGGNSITISGP